MKFNHLEKIQSLAIVGATGLVGREFVNLLQEFHIKIPRVKLLASESSIGESVHLFGKQQYVDVLEKDSFRDVEVAFFSVPNPITKTFVPKALEQGCLVVDDSSVYRMEKETPLIVPQVNGSLLRQFTGKILSTPNCTVTPLVLCLKPLMECYGLKRVVVSTYQSISGAGRVAFEALSKQAIALLTGSREAHDPFPHRFAFNCIPQVGESTDSGYSEEETKLIQETRKILEIGSLKITATAVRVPTFCGHGLSVNVEFLKKFGTLQEIRDLFDAVVGLKVLDSPAKHIYPTNVECIGNNLTLVGRIRQDPSVPFGINFWVISDNLRKGAALNAMEIIDLLYTYRHMV